MKSSERERSSTVSRAVELRAERNRRRRRSYFEKKPDRTPGSASGVWIAVAAIIGVAIVLAVVTKINSFSKSGGPQDSTWGLNLQNLRLP